MWNRDSPISVVSLHWWPQRDWSSLQPRLRRASSQTVTRPSCRQCDSPSHLISHSFSFPVSRSLQVLLPASQLTQLLGGSPVESLQSHFILTMSQWSSGVTLCFPSQGTWVQIPWGGLMWNQDSPVSVVLLQCHLWTSTYTNMYMYMYTCMFIYTYM
jgi:hypothetical protein